ncbi:MAG TPA: hypothetical protein VFT85_04235, partial [Acidimicrobiia bacterium]|nr:hypothetical protein [Acidimicrobiia bacterium]
MTNESVSTSVHESMARFRSSLLRRASAVAWIVLIITGFQAVRSPLLADGSQLFTQPEFYIPMAGLALLLIMSSALRWDKIMRSPAAPWAAAGWL